MSQDCVLPEEVKLCCSESWALFNFFALWPLHTALQLYHSLLHSVMTRVLFMLQPEQHWVLQWVCRLSSLSLGDLLHVFENLTNNCLFGFFMRTVCVFLYVHELSNINVNICVCVFVFFACVYFISDFCLQCDQGLRKVLHINAVFTCPYVHSLFFSLEQCLHAIITLSNHRLAANVGISITSTHYFCLSSTKCFTFIILNTVKFICHNHNLF